MKLDYRVLARPQNSKLWLGMELNTIEILLENLQKRESLLSSQYTIGIYLKLCRFVRIRDFASIVLLLHINKT